MTSDHLAATRFHQETSLDHLDVTLRQEETWHGQQEKTL
jgi:hypothetical protein